MKFAELFETRPNPISGMSDQERHEMLEFIGLWLAGDHMGSKSPELLTRWKRIAALWPPKVPAQARLYRLVTLPIRFADKKQFRFRPAPSLVSSWSSTHVGIDCVAGVAREFGFENESNTCRVQIEATLPGRLVLATPKTIRDAVLSLSHDYFDRYPEAEKRTPDPDGRMVLSYHNPGYPGGDNARFTMDQVGFLQDVLTRPGGHYRQYEHVVETPDMINAKLVRVYRRGDRMIRQGNDDPHN